MAAKSGTLGRIASKTIAAGRSHVSKVLAGEETLPEAAGAAVEDLLSGSKSRSAAKSTAVKLAKKVVKKKVSASTRPKAKARRKSRK